MLEWLQTILEGAKVEDGKLDVTAVMNAVKSEFPKNAVPKTEFNDKVQETLYNIEVGNRLAVCF